MGSCRKNTRPCEAVLEIIRANVSVLAFFLAKQPDYWLFDPRFLFRVNNLLFSRKLLDQPISTHKVAAFFLFVRFFPITFNTQIPRKHVTNVLRTVFAVTSCKSGWILIGCVAVGAFSSYTDDSTSYFVTHLCFPQWQFLVSMSFAFTSVLVICQTDCVLVNVFQHFVNVFLV